MTRRREMKSFLNCSSKTRTYLFYITNIIGADVLATQGHTFQWNFIRNSSVFFQQNAIENIDLIVCIMGKLKSIFFPGKPTPPCPPNRHSTYNIIISIPKWYWHTAVLLYGWSKPCVTLQWCHNEHDSVSNHQPHDCLHKRNSCADQRKHQSSASLDFVRRIHRWPPSWDIS